MCVGSWRAYPRTCWWKLLFTRLLLQYTSAEPEPCTTSACRHHPAHRGVFFFPFFQHTNLTNTLHTIGNNTLIKATASLHLFRPNSKKKPGTGCWARFRGHRSHPHRNLHSPLRRRPNVSVAPGPATRQLPAFGISTSARRVENASHMNPPLYHPTWNPFRFKTVSDITKRSA